MARFGLIAGHGGADPGAVLGARLEKNDNLKLCKAVGEMLKGRGHEVVYFREDDRACPAHLSRRWINETAADFFICFHRNAYNKKAFGTEVWTFSDEKSVKVGNTLCSKISAAGGFYNRGRKAGGAAWISEEKPCCQLEIGFLDNENDNALYDKNYYAITRAIADGLEEHFEKGKGTAKETKATATDWLNIRVAPNLKGTILGSIPKGRECTVLSVENGWAKVVYGGIKGYSSTDYLVINEVKEEEPEVVLPEEKQEEAPSYNFLYSAFLKIAELLRGKVKGGKLE